MDRILFPSNVQKQHQTSLNPDCRSKEISKTIIQFHQIKPNCRPPHRLSMKMPLFELCVLSASAITMTVSGDSSDIQYDEYDHYDEYDVQQGDEGDGHADNVTNFDVGAYIGIGIGFGLLTSLFSFIALRQCFGWWSWLFQELKENTWVCSMYNNLHYFRLQMILFVALCL